MADDKTNEEAGDNKKDQKTTDYIVGVDAIEAETNTYAKEKQLNVGEGVNILKGISDALNVESGEIAVTKKDLHRLTDKFSALTKKSEEVAEKSEKVASDAKADGLDEKEAKKLETEAKKLEKEAKKLATETVSLAGQAVKSTRIAVEKDGETNYNQLNEEQVKSVKEKFADKFAATKDSPLNKEEAEKSFDKGYNAKTMGTSMRVGAGVLGAGVLLGGLLYGRSKDIDPDDIEQEAAEKPGLFTRIVKGLARAAAVVGGALLVQSAFNGKGVGENFSNNKEAIGKWTGLIKSEDKDKGGLAKS